MNLAELQKKLNAAARLQMQTPDERVPYAFEKRIMALLAARAVVDRWALFTRGLWRAAISCVVVAIIFGAVSLFVPAAKDKGNAKDLSQEFENTLLASADQADYSTMP
jgi:hypothetical protein